MDILRTVLRGLLAVALSAALSIWILVATLNATIANREVVKQWLVASGVYQNALGSVLQVSASSAADGKIVSSDLLQKALAQTFDSAFIQQSTNTVLDASFDWMEGKTQNLTFSIPVQEKAGAFSANLAALVLPKLEALPQCTTRISVDNPNEITCLPAGVNAKDYAAQLTQPSQETNFLQAPLTQDTFKGSFPQSPWLPQAMQWTRTLFAALPIAMLCVAALYVWLSPSKLRGLGLVGRRLTIGAAITLIGGLFLWFSSMTVDVSGSVEATDQQQVAIANTLVNPLARTILPDVGRALTLYSGIVVAVAGATWLGAFIWRHKRSSGQPPHGPLVPPASPHEAQLPPPSGRPTA